MNFSYMAQQPVFPYELQFYSFAHSWYPGVMI